MDILIYLVLIGLGVAASEPRSESYEYYSEDATEVEPSEDDAMSDDIATEAPAEPEAVPEPDPAPGFAAVSPPAAPAQPGFGTVAPPSASGGYAAEDQTATGRMTTAGEVRPILTVTKGSWIAVRDWEGQDLLYFTNLLAWRCGLHEISYSVNGGPEQVLAAEPCYTEEGAPNALKMSDVLPYVTLGPGEVQTVTVSVLYDDLSTDRAEYSRQQVQIN